VVSRIRWKSIFAMLLLAAAAYVIVQAMPGGYSVGGNVGIRVTAEPSKVSPGESSMVDIELKNMRDKEDINVIVTADTHDKDVFFDESYAQTYGSQSINIGPLGKKKFVWKVRTKPEVMQGEYVIDFKASTKDSNGAETKLYLVVEKS